MSCLLQEDQRFKVIKKSTSRRDVEVWIADVKHEIVVQRGVKRMCAGSRLLSTERVRNLEFRLETCLMSVSG